MKPKISARAGDTMVVVKVRVREAGAYPARGTTVNLSLEEAIAARKELDDAIADAMRQVENRALAAYAIAKGKEMKR